MPGETKQMELMTVPKKKNFTERLVQVCFAKHCSSGKRAEHLFTVAKKQRIVFQSSVTERSSWRHL